jgi:hypothetical protein
MPGHLSPGLMASSTKSPTIIFDRISSGCTLMIRSAEHSSEAGDQNGDMEVDMHSVRSC